MPCKWAGISLHTPYLLSCGTHMGQREKVRFNSFIKQTDNTTATTYSRQDRLLGRHRRSTDRDSRHKHKHNTPPREALPWGTAATQDLCCSPEHTHTHTLTCSRSQLGVSLRLMGGEEAAHKMDANHIHAEAGELGGEDYC